MPVALSSPAQQLGLGTEPADDDEERRRRERESMVSKFLGPGASPMAKQLGLMSGAGALSAIGTGLGRGY